MRKIVISILALVLVALFSLNAQAQSSLGFNGIGGSISMVKPDDSDTSIGFGAHVDFGQITTGLHLYPSIEYFNNKVTEDTIFGEVEAEASVLSLNGDVRYYFPTQGKVGFFAGGGLAIHMTGDTEVDGQEVAEGQTDVGLNLLGGLELPVSERLSFSGLAKYIVSDNNGFKITAGLTYAMVQ